MSECYYTFLLYLSVHSSVLQSSFLSVHSLPGCPSPCMSSICLSVHPVSPSICVSLGADRQMIMIYHSYCLVKMPLWYIYTSVRAGYKHWYNHKLLYPSCILITWVILTIPYASVCSSLHLSIFLSIYLPTCPYLCPQKKHPPIVYFQNWWSSESINWYDFSNPFFGKLKP